jgi:3D (Asp-Asp-Asp) domain-containing protein
MILHSLLFFLLLSCASENTVIRPLVNSVKKNVRSSNEKMYLLKPTIYYLPRFTAADHESCGVDEQTEFKTAENELLLKTCYKTLKFCEMQGTCEIEINKKPYLITVDKKNDDNERLFRTVDTTHCKYGMGASKDTQKSYKFMCVEPFYSVAADLSIYNLGDVLFIPALKNIKLPTGGKHSGYVIVRDSGQLVKGEGRFDFFTGRYNVSKKNPFYNLGLSDNDQKLEYRLVAGAEAEQIRYVRRFPGVR